MEPNVPRKVLIVRNIEVMSREEIKKILEGLGVDDQAPASFNRLLELATDDSFDEMDALKLLKEEQVRDYLHEIIKKNTGNYVIYHLNGIKEESANLLPAEIDAHAEYIKNKLRDIPENTEFDMMYLGGGHGDLYTVLSGLSPTQAQDIANLLQQKHTQFKAIVFGSCFSAAHSPLFLPLLTKNGVMLSNSLECGGNNFFLDTVKWMQGSEDFFSASDIKSSKQTFKEAKSACKRVLDELNDPELEQQYLLKAFAQMAEKERANERSKKENLAIIRNSSALSKEFNKIRNRLIAPGMPFAAREYRYARNNSLPLDFAHAIYEQLADEYKTQVNNIVSEFRRSKGSSNTGLFNAEEYQAIYRQLSLIDDIKNKISNHLIDDYDAFVMALYQADLPITHEFIKKLLNDGARFYLKEKIYALILQKMQGNDATFDEVEHALFDEYVQAVTTNPTSLVVRTLTETHLQDLRVKPENTSGNFKEMLKLVLSKIKGDVIALHFNQDFDRVSAKKKFNSLLSSATMELTPEDSVVETPVPSLNENRTVVPGEDLPKAPNIPTEQQQQPPPEARKQEPASPQPHTPEISSVEHEFNKYLEVLDAKIANFEMRANTAYLKSSKESLNQAKAATKNLRDKLQKAGTKYFQHLDTAHYTVFKESSKTLIKEARVVLDKHRGWSEFFTNLSLFIIGVAPFLLKGITNLLFRDKSFLFIHETDSTKVAKELGENIEKLAPKTK